MNLIFNVLEIVTPVFFLAGIGFTWVKMGFEYNVEFVTRLAVTLSVPCLIFVALMKTEISSDTLQAVSLATVTAYALVTGGSFLIVRVMRLDISTYLAPITFGNTGNLGLPLAFFAFGNEGLGYAVIIFAIMAIYNFTCGVWVISGGGSLLKVIKEPMVWGTFLGAIFLINNWETPKFLTSTLELVGQMAIPLMLITLGVAVARLQPQDVYRAFIISTLKFLICITSAIIAGIYFKLDSIPLAVLIIQLTTPVAVTSYLLATKYNDNPNAVAGLVIVSTLLSIVYIPITLMFLI